MAVRVRRPDLEVVAVEAVVVGAEPSMPIPVPPGEYFVEAAIPGRPAVTTSVRVDEDAEGVIDLARRLPADPGRALSIAVGASPEPIRPSTLTRFWVRSNGAWHRLDRRSGVEGVVGWQGPCLVQQGFRFTVLSPSWPESAWPDLKWLRVGAEVGGSRLLASQAMLAHMRHLDHTAARVLLEHVYQTLHREHSPSLLAAVGYTFARTDSWRLRELVPELQKLGRMVRLPDLKILEAWTLLQGKRSPMAILEAGALLRRAIGEGLPLYTEGLDYLARALRLYRVFREGEAEPWVATSLRRVEAYNLAADWSETLTVFTGLHPDRPRTLPPWLAEVGKRKPRRAGLADLMRARVEALRDGLVVAAADVLALLFQRPQRAKRQLPS